MYVHTFFFLKTQAHFKQTTLQCKHNFHLYQETKKFLWRPLLWSFALLQWLEPNPQYLWGMPVCFMYLIFSEML